MKTRIGFVSNSSSSSFVLAGFRLTEGDEQEEIISACRKYKLDYMADDANIIYIGETLSSMENYNMPDKDYSLDQQIRLKEKLLAIPELVKHIKDKDFNIFVRTIGC